MKRLFYSFRNYQTLYLKHNCFCRVTWTVLLSWLASNKYLFIRMQPIQVWSLNIILFQASAFHSSYFFDQIFFWLLQVSLLQYTSSVYFIEWCTCSYLGTLNGARCIHILLVLQSCLDVAFVGWSFSYHPALQLSGMTKFRSILKTFNAFKFPNDFWDTASWYSLKFNYYLQPHVLGPLPNLQADFFGNVLADFKYNFCSYFR